MGWGSERLVAHAQQTLTQKYPPRPRVKMGKHIWGLKKGTLDLG